MVQQGGGDIYCEAINDLIFCAQLFITIAYASLNLEKLLVEKSISLIFESHHSGESTLKALYR